jgi:hypothetical protein
MSEDDDDRHAIMNRASALCREFNIVFGVAQKSTDYPTRLVRLTSAKTIFASLEELVLRYPYLSLTALGNVTKTLVKIEEELAAERAMPDCEGALWVFHAGFFLSTPLNHLHDHGLIAVGARASLPIIHPQNSRSRWALVGPTFRELGFEIDNPSEFVASDIGTIPAHGEPYLSFLIMFRELIESGLPEGEIVKGLLILSTRDSFASAVFERLGPALSMIKRAAFNHL